jgi:hypothetical protein
LAEIRAAVLQFSAAQLQQSCSSVAAQLQQSCSTTAAQLNTAEQLDKDRQTHTTNSMHTLTTQQHQNDIHREGMIKQGIVWE